jgi:predicted ATPase
MDSIHIKGYKSIKDAKIDLKPINILIGGNGSGKSNFLSFFEFLNSMVERRLQIYVALKGMEKFLHNGRAITSTIWGEIEFDSGYYEFELEAGDQALIFTKEYIKHNGASMERDTTPPNFEAIFLGSTRGELPTNTAAGQIRDIKKYHFHDTGRTSPFNHTNNIRNDSYYLYEDGRNLAAFLFNIKEKNPLTYKRIIDTIRIIAPYFSDFYFEPNENDLLSLQWRDKYSSILYGATDLSDGTIRFIALAVLFLQPKLPSTIIIDEPELGLHPQAISILAGLIRSASKRGAQVIAATQSAELIDHFQPEDILTVDQIDGESHFSRLSSEELANWLYDYSLGDLWKQNIIGKAQP